MFNRPCQYKIKIYNSMEAIKTLLIFTSLPDNELSQICKQWYLIILAMEI